MAMQGSQLHLNHLGEGFFLSSLPATKINPGHTRVTENDTGASRKIQKKQGGHGGKNIIFTGKIHAWTGCQGFEIQCTS